MSLPLLAGLPWLASIITGIISGLFGWFLKFATKRFAIVLAAVALLTAITAAFYAAIQVLLDGLTTALPDFFTVAAGWVIPENATICISAVLSAHAIRWVYAWQVRIIEYKIGG